MTVGRRLAASIALAAIIALTAGCSHLVFGPDDTLTVSNGTTLRLAVAVNGRSITQVEPGRSVVVASGELPARPWSVAVTTVGGRRIAVLDVAEGSVVDERALDGTGSYSAPFSRTVLSCGEVWIQVGDLAPGGGPNVAPPVADDCQP